MITRPLNEAISDGFIPFSYVWGDPRDSEIVIVNGTHKSFGKNLVTLLRYARDFLLPALPTLSSSYGGRPLFWADAICINQKDIPERNHQVSLMTRIYGSSQIVVHWLGIHENSQLAAELFGTITEQWYRKTVRNDSVIGYNYTSAPNHGKWMNKFPGFWRKDSDQHMRNKYWNAVLSITWSEFWRRTWIFQEIVLPQENWMLCGPTMFRLSDMSCTIMWIRNLAFNVREHADLDFVHKDLLNRLVFGNYLKLDYINRIGYCKGRGSQGRRPI